MRPHLTAWLAVTLLLSPISAVAQEFRLLTGFDRNYPQNAIVLDPFMKGVESSSKGRMKFTVSGPETVPAFEQLEPVASGVFQFLHTVGAYHFGTTPILTVMGALQGEPSAIRASGIIDIVDKHYQKLGLKLVVLAISGEGAYQILVKQPIGPSGDLQGRKIRGTPAYTSVIKMLGATMVTMPPAEIYTALEKGVVDGFAWTVTGIPTYRFNEVAKLFVRPTFGVETFPILMNLASWNKLAETDRKILMQEARKVEDLYSKEARRLAQDEENALLAKGMGVTQLGEAQKSQLRAAWSNGLWELGASKNPKDVGELRAFARSKNLAK